MALVIKCTQSGDIIAQGVPDETVIEFEGNWYFAPEAVAMNHITITDRPYTCPYKGRALWIDLKSSIAKDARNIGWVYQQPLPGYEFIAGRIAFYARDTSATQAIRTQDSAPAAV